MTAYWVGGAILAGLIAAPVHAEVAPITEGEFAVLDLNADGALSQTEFGSFIIVSFTTLDVDKSGYLETAEVVGVVADAQYAAADTDGDGKLSPAEVAGQMLADFTVADKNGDGKLE